MPEEEACRRKLPHALALEEQRGEGKAMCGGAWLNGCWSSFCRWRE